MCSSIKNKKLFKKEFGTRFWELTAIVTAGLLTFVSIIASSFTNDRKTIRPNRISALIDAATFRTDTDISLNFIDARAWITG
ncbi:MAG: hypothetical protein A2840_01355 [Candidatus Buchananbacteria bacterium RIFCSPHIGHO2_01_FULL_47_11b]|uniref:Uncharacterized protein n=1 Tax=Candidatus Buchananbacteria bacterium RIFCSPHIGHO2_01_FULL_47_11b TaxID=1797537 RepID=A0A1G1Y3N5_9BACT|nr:MAG: hypothetical protein A2840_01355 [Candidatus Buchananbacteria bacterium RIFCSPHIGHO2_01_FULL_47_11b]